MVDADVPPATFSIIDDTNSCCFAFILFNVEIFWPKHFVVVSKSRFDNFAGDEQLQAGLFVLSASDEKCDVISLYLISWSARPQQEIQAVCFEPKSSRRASEGVWIHGHGPEHQVNLGKLENPADLGNRVAELL